MGVTAINTHKRHKHDLEFAKNMVKALKMCGRDMYDSVGVTPV